MLFLFLAPDASSSVNVGMLSGNEGRFLFQILSRFLSVSRSFVPGWLGDYAGLFLWRWI
jgi:hypothetical protein